MKITNVGLDNAYAIVRGWVSEFAAAASGLISISDETTGTSVAPVNSITLPGQLLNDGGLGNIVIDVQAVLTEYLNNSGVDLIYGDVVVVDSSADLAVTTTTMAQDTRPVGIVLASIGAGGTGPVQTGGVVQFVNVTASVTRGEFAETSGTAKAAQQSATRHSGSFGIFLEAGTSPAVLLFGIPDSSGTGGLRGLDSVSDGTTSVAPTVQMVVPVGGVADLGSDTASLHVLTSRSGAQDEVHTITASGAAATIDCAIANAFDITLTANCTFTIANPPPSGVLGQILVVRRQGGSGSYTETWPASVKWPAANGTMTGSAPTLKTAVGAEDIVLLSTVDGGITWGGTSVATGSVTSVALTVPAEFSISGSPVTSSGTLAISKATETAATVWAGPTSGSAAQPTFRALALTDLPSGTTDHEHIMNLWFSGDGATTAFELPAAAFDSQSVRVWVSGTLTDVTLSGTMLTTMTFGSAPASATNNIVVDLVAAAA